MEVKKQHKDSTESYRLQKLKFRDKHQDKKEQVKTLKHHQKKKP